MDSGYRVVAVDGVKESRAAGKVVTMVPVVLVDPGVHTFSVRHSGIDAPVSVSAKVEANKEYRVAVKEDGMPTIVEYGR